MIFNQNNQNGPAYIAPLTGTAALVDTSVIIDGRIADISRAGFAPGKLLIPRFVLAELQNIADSSDAMRRGRGRRGLEVLNDMRQAGVDMEIIELDAPEITEVDAKLVRLARQLQVNVLTTDYNLNRVASIEGVRVLNINELANAVRPVIIPGEKMMVKIVQPGKEKGQGVGYLADGTMIVVDNSDRLIGQEVATEITRVFQTVAGKMLFAVPVDARNVPAAARVEAPKPKEAARPNGKPRQNDRQRRDNRDTRDIREQAPDRKENNGKSERRPSKPRMQDVKPAGGPVKPTKNGRTESSDPARTARPRKRLSPTQKLENSLMEMTKGDDA